jgi:hypothetical protein
MPDDPNAAAKPKGERLKAPKPNFDHFRSNGDGNGYDHPDDQPGARNGRGGEPAKKLLVTRLSHVSVEPVIWFWQNRVPLGALSIVGGEPESGKTTLLLDAIARSTTGREWPNGEGTAKRGMWIYVTTENDTVRTLKPRLIAAGGDVSQFAVIKGTVEKKDRRKPREQRGFDLSQDLTELDSLIEHGFSTDHLDCIGVVVDPLNEFLGSGTNSWKDSDVRRVLGPLVALAERRQIAVIGIMHPNKNSEASSLLNKILGSVAFGATARVVHYAAKDDEASDQGQPQFVFSVAKNNLSRRAASLAYELPVTRIEPQKGDDPEKVAQIEEMVHVRWLGPTDRSAADVVFKKDEPESRSTAGHRDAVAWLTMRLGNDRVPVATVEREAKDNGVKRSALRFAYEALNVRREKEGFGGAWVMFLPPRESGRGSPFTSQAASDRSA